MPNAKQITIVRDPIQQFISCYEFYHKSGIKLNEKYTDRKYTELRPTTVLGSMTGCRFFKRPEKISGINSRRRWDENFSRKPKKLRQYMVFGK